LDYTTPSLGPSCHDASLHIFHTVPAGLSATSASAPSPGQVLSNTEIKYLWTTSGTYPANDFRISSQPIIYRSYYHANGQAVAMRVSGEPNPAKNTIYFLLTDHLGGTNVTLNANGTRKSELRYKAWGEARASGYADSATPTDRQFTGQIWEGQLGLYFYNARWYDPYLNRWIQPDSIIPDQYNPLDYDRYSYVRNNPVIYTDPTGHDVGCSAANPACADSNGPSAAEIFARHHDPFYDMLGYDNQSLWRSVVAGAPCTGCHLTHNTGRVPGNDELSITQISKWKSLDKYAAPVLFSGLGSVAAMAQQAISVSDPLSYIPQDYAENVSDAFADWHVGYAQENVSAYRYTSPYNSPEGHWLTFDPSFTPDQARATLALPNSNIATRVTQFVIPKGTNFIYGTATGQTNTTWAGSYAIGRGQQIYVPSVERLLGVPLLP
jgi:RHS repeat-associated protein